MTRSKSVATASGEVLSGLWSLPRGVEKNFDHLKKTPPARLFIKMREDNAFDWAVIIAWNFLQSLFPIALVMAAVLGVGLGYVGVGSQHVYETITSIIPDTNAQREVLATLKTFQQKSGIFFLVGFAGLIWSGASLFRTIEQAFAVIYHTRQRPLIKGIFMSVGMVLLLTVFGGLMVVSTTLLGLLSPLPFLPTVLANGTVGFGLQIVFGLGLGFMLFLAIYYVVPNRRLDWGKVWVGAALAGVLFEGLSLIFPLYLRMTGVGSTFGKTFGILFLLMIYFYLLGNVTMIGVEVNSLRYRVPVDQPQGKESLVTPGQVREPAAPPRANVGPARRPTSNGVLTHVARRLTAGLRRKPRVS
jgi:YihY family inner membrane protein